MDNREMLITALKQMQVEAIREISLNPEKKAEVLKNFQIAFSKMVSSTYIFFASMIEAPEEFLYDGLLVATKLADSFGVQSIDDSKAQVRRLAMALEHYAEAYEEPVMNDWMVQHIKHYETEHKKAMDSLRDKLSKAFEGDDAEAPAV